MSKQPRRPTLNLRGLHLAITIALAVVLSFVAITSIGDRARLRDQLRYKTDENAALRKRAERAEANTRLAIERFSGVMTALANDNLHLTGRSLARHEKSFVQVYGFFTRRGKKMVTAGTACYLGGGYFLTARHVVVPEAEPKDAIAPKTTSIDLKINGQMVSAEVVDQGANPRTDDLDTADWAVLAASKIPEGLVPLKPNPDHTFVFGERLVRYGNDSNRGIAVAAGYVAQVSENGWISWLVDSLPGCSGGGVMDNNDELVGLNGGYLDGSTRLAVIIPIRREMFRKLSR